DRTVVAGQSFGGLAAMFADKAHPAAGLRVWLEAGQREPIIFRANQALLAQLTTTQQTIFWRQVDGGHDALCWRGGLTAGLIQLWQPLLSHP
ncbi:enterochelin esterase, partial [Klebsiella pneumoniae]